MKIIDADALIDDLEYDVDLDARALDNLDLDEVRKAIVQFDMDCKKNAIDLLRNAPTIKPEPHWIPCSERLPMSRDWYLGIFKEPDTGWINPIPFICEYLLGTRTKATTKEGWILKECTDGEEHIDYYLNLECVAWMPLPEPYKEDNKVSDLISRQAAIDALERSKKIYFDRQVIIGAMKDIVRNLPSAQPEQPWIPCSERLPKDGTWNIFSDGKNISVERYKMDAIDHFFPQGRWFNFDEAIAWMPLPDMYERGEQE